MDYKQKYLKYKSKYLNLKGSGFSLKKYILQPMLRTSYNQSRASAYSEYNARVLAETNQRESRNRYSYIYTSPTYLPWSRIINQEIRYLSKPAETLDTVETGILVENINGIKLPNVQRIGVMIKIKEEDSWIFGMNLYGRLSDFGGGCKKMHNIYDCLKREITEEFSEEMATYVMNNIHDAKIYYQTDKDHGDFSLMYVIDISLSNMDSLKRSFVPRKEIKYIEKVPLSYIQSSDVPLTIFHESIIPFIKVIFDKS